MADDVLWGDEVMVDCGVFLELSRGCMLSTFWGLPLFVEIPELQGKGEYFLPSDDSCDTLWGVMKYWRRGAGYPIMDRVVAWHDWFAGMDQDEEHKKTNDEIALHGTITFDCNSCLYLMMSCPHDTFRVSVMTRRGRTGAVSLLIF